MRKIENLEEHFWSKVEIKGNDDCWEWKAARHYKGYGQYDTGERHGFDKKSHRMAWWLKNGDPGNLHVLHTCDNPPCCNPSHLFLGTNQDNVNDKIKKGRHPTGKACVGYGKPMICNRGEKNKFSKLKEQEVISIFLDKRQQRCIAEEYGVSGTTIFQIRNGKKWGWLTNSIQI